MAFKIQRFIPASPLTMPDPDPKDPKNPKDPKDPEIDPTKLKYKNTKSVSTINNRIVPVKGEATVTIGASREKTKFSKDSNELKKQKDWIKNNPSKYKKMISETNDKIVNVTRERNYKVNETPRKLYANPYKNPDYQRYEKGRNSRLAKASIAGDSLSLPEIEKLARMVDGPGFHKSITIRTFMNRNKVGYGNTPRSSGQSKKGEMSNWLYNIDKK